MPRTGEGARQGTRRRVIVSNPGAERQTQGRPAAAPFACRRCLPSQRRRSGAGCPLDREAMSRPAAPFRVYSGVCCFVSDGCQSLPAREASPNARKDLPASRCRGPHLRRLGSRPAPSRPAIRCEQTASPTLSLFRRPTSPARCTWGTRSTTPSRTSCAGSSGCAGGTAVAAGHRPRRHRHPAGGGAPADEKQQHRRDMARKSSLSWCGSGRPSPAAPSSTAEAARRLVRLVARTVHHGRTARPAPC